MNLEELREHKKMYEAGLLAAIAELTEEFKERTGWSPENIYCYFTETTSIGSERKTYIISRVTVNLEPI